jgi:hypothetical protein
MEVSEEEGLVFFFALARPPCRRPPLSILRLAPLLSPPHKSHADGNPTFKGEKAITSSGPVTSKMPSAHVG